MSTHALFGKNLFGEEIKPKPTGPLAERFIFPPFSVLDARQGEWQRRKRAWIATGIESELGRNSEDFAIGDKATWDKQNKKIEPGGGGGPNSCYLRKKKIHPGGGNDALEIMGSSKKYGVNSHLDEQSQKTLGCYGAYGKTTVDRAQGGATGTSIFDLTLCELIYRWFCPQAGQVIDPFAGGSVRGIVAALLGLNYWGCDLRPEQIEANRQQADVICGDVMPEWVVGDSLDLLPHAPFADLIFSCPPYGDLEVYSDHPRDLSNMEYHTFMPALKRIILQSVMKLKPGGIACFVVGDFRDKKTGNYRGFVAHTIQAFQEVGLHLFNEAILITPCGSLPIRVSNQFEKSKKLGKTHQNVLIFRRYLMPTCVICGHEFPNRKYRKPLKTCGPECRLALRKKVGLETGEKMRQTKTIVRECLKCNRPFKTLSPYIRLCRSCKDNSRVHDSGAGWWGVQI